MRTRPESGRWTEHLEAKPLKVAYGWRADLVRGRQLCQVAAMGDPDKQKLQASLESSGWHVERRPGDEWWQHEVWHLTSTWRPRSAVAFITLLVDWESKHRPDIRSVWAITVSSSVPTGWTGQDCTIRVSPRLPERLKEVVAATGELRPAA